MLDYLFQLFSQNLAIDLGTANTLLLIHNEGIKIVEPSVLAINKVSGKLIAVGREAEMMLGKTPPDIVAIKPLKEGVIADFEATSKMLDYYIKLLHPGKMAKYLGARPKVVIGIPSEVTEVERRAVSKAVISAGARACYLIDEPMAAAIGAGLKIAAPSGSFIVDIGGGTCEIALISLGGTVNGKSLRMAGESMNNNIIEYVKASKGLLIGDKTAEKCKVEIGSALTSKNSQQVLTCEVSGRETSSGLPRAITLNSNEVAEAIKPTLSAIVIAIKQVLEHSPPELVADVQKTGLTLAGGSSLLRQIDKLITMEIGVKAELAQDPQTCVVRGCGYLLENEALLKRVVKS